MTAAAMHGLAFRPKAIATAFGRWEELVQNPQIRIHGLAATHDVTESRITRMLRLAFTRKAAVRPAFVTHYEAISITWTIWRREWA